MGRIRRHQLPSVLLVVVRPHVSQGCVDLDVLVDTSRTIARVSVGIVAWVRDVTDAKAAVQDQPIAGRPVPALALAPGEGGPEEAEGFGFGFGGKDLEGGVFGRLERIGVVRCWTVIAVLVGIRIVALVVVAFAVIRVVFLTAGYNILLVGTVGLVFDILVVIVTFVNPHLGVDLLPLQQVTTLRPVLPLPCIPRLLQPPPHVGLPHVRPVLRLEPLALVRQPSEHVQYALPDHAQVSHPPGGPLLPLFVQVPPALLARRVGRVALLPHGYTAQVDPTRALGAVGVGGELVRPYREGVPVLVGESSADDHVLGFDGVDVRGGV
mmetsp:Transcript_13528/g.25336  ORF Transcript_13528/g.25336 Transcript_13528/m.25336 type:complete len:323 (-) Transcript_13528:450-1418(-)